MVLATYEVPSDKVLVVEVTIGLGASRENIEVLGQSDQTTEEERNDGSPETQWSNIGQLIIGNSLSTTCADEVDVRNKQRNPGQQTEDGGEVDEVAENDGR